MNLDPKYYPRERAIVDQLMLSMDSVVDLSVKFPDNPFRHHGGRLDFCQFDWAISRAFGPVVREIARAHKDPALVAAALEPGPDYFGKNYGRYPAFALSVDEATADFFAVVDFSPEGDPTGSIHFASDVFAITGSGGSWAVWAERRWEIAVVWTSNAVRPRWTDLGVPFVTLEEAIHDFARASAGPLMSAEHRMFLENFGHR